MLLKVLTVLLTLILSAIAFSVVGFKPKVSALRLAPKRFGPSLVMMAKGPPKNKCTTKHKATPKATSKSVAPLAAQQTSPLYNTIWAKLSGEFGEKVFSLKCDPASTTIDEYKKLVKIEFSPLLDGVAAPMLEIKGADGEALRAGMLLSSRPEGKSEDDPFLVEAPKKSSGFLFYF